MIYYYFLLLGVHGCFQQIAFDSCISLTTQWLDCGDNEWFCRCYLSTRLIDCYLLCSDDVEITNQKNNLQSNRQKYDCWQSEQLKNARPLEWNQWEEKLRGLVGSGNRTLEVAVDDAKNGGDGDDIVKDDGTAFITADAACKFAPVWIAFVVLFLK